MVRPAPGLELAERSAQFASFRRLIDQGIAALEARDTGAATECFAAAHDLAVRFRLGDDAVCGTLLNLGMAQRLAGHYEGALASFRSALAVPGISPAQRAALWNHIGVLYGERARYRTAAACYIRAYRLAMTSGGDADLLAETAGNAVDAYLHLDSSEKAVRWAARATWHARRAAPWRRQGVALQVVAACLATGRMRLARRILHRLEREPVAPDWLSQLLRLRAEWWFRAGDLNRALACAIRALDAAVRDLSAEDLDDACRLLARFRRQWFRDEPAHTRWASQLRQAVREHQEIIGAFARACADLELAADRQVAAILTNREGLILLRAGGEEALNHLAEMGFFPGTTVSLTGGQETFARAAVARPGGGAQPGNRGQPGDRELPGGRIQAGAEVHAAAHAEAPAGYVLVWPAQPALARAIATLTARIHAGERAARLRAESEQALAKLSAFHEAALALGGPLETGQVVARLLALTRQVSRSDGVALLFTHAGRGTWADGLDGEVLRRSRVFHRTAETGRPQRLTRDEPRGGEELNRLGVSSLIAVPIYFGGTSCGAVLVAARLAGAPFSEEDLELVAFVSKQFGLALENAALRDDLSRRLDAVTRDLRIARRLQEAFMPRTAVQEDGVLLAGLSLPAKYVGGDLYDFTRFPDGSWGLALGDVMGKGVGAAMLGSILLARLRETWQREPFGPDLVRRLDAAVSPDLRRGRAIATLALGRYDPRHRRLRVLTAGHDGPVLWRHGRWQPITRGGGTALGLTAGGGAVVDVPVTLAPGDVVLFYSDGFGELVLERPGTSAAVQVAEALMRRDWRPAAGDSQALVDQIRRLAAQGDHADDVTVVVLGAGAYRG